MARCRVLAVIMLCIAVLLGALVNVRAQMRRVFVSELVIRNECSSAILVTPIGVHAGGGYVTLPVVRGQTDGRLSRRTARWALDPGGEVTIYFDDDDANVAGVVVEVPGAPPRQLLLDEPLEGGGAVDVSEGRLVGLSMVVEDAFRAQLRSPLPLDLVAVAMVAMSMILYVVCTVRQGKRGKRPLGHAGSGC